MTICERFDVAVVPFPFADRAKSKPRPALIASNAAFNRAHGHSILAMITTARATRWPSDHQIIDLEAAGLGAPSVVRCKLFTLDNRLVARRIGRLGSADARQVAERLREALA
jgi:mRNA interferase MazF